MKKLALVTAVAAATICTGAHASPISSAIAGIELKSSGIPIAIDCASTWNTGFSTGLALSGTGTGAGQINFVGNVCLDPSFSGGPYVALDFGLRGGAVAPAPPGTTFNGGRIDIYADYGSGWNYAYTVDAAVTAIDCLDNSATAVGLQWPAPPATIPLPGPDNGTNAVCETTLLGQPSALYLTGTITN